MHTRRVEEEDTKHRLDDDTEEHNRVEGRSSKRHLSRLASEDIAPLHEDDSSEEGCLRVEESVDRVADGVVRDGRDISHIACRVERNGGFNLAKMVASNERSSEIVHRVGRHLPIDVVVERAEVHTSARVAANGSDITLFSLDQLEDVRVVSSRIREDLESIRRDGSEETSLRGKSVVVGHAVESLGGESEGVQCGVVSNETSACRDETHETVSMCDELEGDEMVCLLSRLSAHDIEFSFFVGERECGENICADADTEHENIRERERDLDDDEREERDDLRDVGG